MRLHLPERAYGWPQLVAMRVLGRVVGRVPDPVRVQWYRPRFYGRPRGVYGDVVMRGPSYWSVGERELLASFVSSCYQCPFCTQTHGAVASRALQDQETVDAVLRDWRTAPVRAGLRATLGFLEKLAQIPDEVTPADVDVLREAGLPDHAIAAAVHICAVFTITSRVSDAFDFEVPDEESRMKIAKVMLTPFRRVFTSG